MTSNIRTPCETCKAAGELLDPESGLWRVCWDCLGNCYLTETPQPHGEVQPDVRDMDTETGTEVS